MSNDTNSHLRELYPHIRFERQWTETADVCYQLGECSAFVTALAGAPILPEYRDLLLRIALRKGAQATTAIEGNTLSDREVEQVQRGEPLEPNQEYQEREVKNIIDAFNALLRDVVEDNRDELITPALIRRFHVLIGKDLGDHLRATPGQWAQSSRVVHPYKAPAPEHVPALIDHLCTWLQREFTYPTQSFKQAIIQAIVTHVYVEWIHPFDDGNGRTGRLVEFYILLRAGLPSIASHHLANYYNMNRPEYYRQLQRAYQTQDLSAFIAFAVKGLRDGLESTLGNVRENAVQQMWRVLVYEKFRALGPSHNAVMTRQRDVALHLPFGNPITILDVPALTERIAKQYEKVKSTRTVIRDLRVLEGLSLITRESGLVRANTALLQDTFAKRRPSVVPPLPSTTSWPPSSQF